MPLTSLAGIGGMSELTMMTGPANWRVAYPAFILGMAVIGAISYWMLKRAETRHAVTLPVTAASSVRGPGNGARPEELT